MDVYLHVHVPAPADLARPSRLARLVLATSLAVLLVFGWGQGELATASGNSIEAPDTAGDVGKYSSLKLDAAGNPVISYHDGDNGNLKVMHCNDSNCSGGGESITSPHGVEYVGAHTSLQLDSVGNPVISYLGNVSSQPSLKIMHCNDPSCAGNNESITAPDTTGGAEFTSLRLDASGNPVVAYYQSATADLKVLHCNDVNCAAGGDSVTSPHTTGIVGAYASLALDAAGRPVISYSEEEGDDLNVMHCNDVNCAGNDESITAPDTGGDVGQYTSIRLDASGYPVVAYYDYTSAQLKLLHCNDANCAGVDDSVTFPDPSGYGGEGVSLMLDAAGRPAIAYVDFTGPDYILNLVHCNDANCAGGDEAINTADSAPNSGSYPSLALDAAGNPVVSHWHIGNFPTPNFDLRVVHCGNANCAKAPPKISIENIGQYALPKSCFEVQDTAQTPVFTVCDNDFDDPPANNAACVPDGVCNDEDPADGAVSVTVASADYRVVESVAAPMHAADTSKQSCDTTSGDCTLTFLNTPVIRPWHPWDLVGLDAGSPPDGRVRVADILEVVSHYFRDKPLPTPASP